MGQMDLLPLSLNFWKNLPFQESEPESLHHCHTAWKDIPTGQQGMSIPCSPPQQLSRSPNTSLHNLNLRFPQLWMLKPHCEHFLLLNCPEGKGGNLKSTPPTHTLHMQPSLGLRDNVLVAKSHTMNCSPSPFKQHKESNNLFYLLPLPKKPSCYQDK